jgi:preprotein translocase subunit SecG
VNVLVALVAIVNVILAIGFIVLVLLHSGKGTGLSSMMGGVMSGAGASAGIIEKNLDRLTVVCALGFFATSLLLMFIYKPAVSVTSPSGTTTTIPKGSTTATQSAPTTP